MSRRALLLLAFGIALVHVLSPVDDARACPVEYVLKEQDTLENIARQIYNDPAKWRIIYYANQDRLGEHSSLLRPGVAIRLPCLGAVPTPQDKSITGTIARKEPEGIIFPFHLTSPEGVGQKIGFIHARNARISVGAREETALILSPHLEGLPPGPHAFHVHSNPDCGPVEENGEMVPGLAAGPHLFLKGTGNEAGITFHSHLGKFAQSACRK
jgi:Cu/Zn superoxide dismutase